MAAAGYLAAVPAELEAELTSGALPKAVEAATFDDRLVAAPWWLDPQLLWYRGTAAERAGLDTTKPISWDDLLAGAERLGSTLQIDDPDGTGLGDWVRASSADPGARSWRGAGRDPKVGLATDAGRVAAGIVQFYASADVGPGPSPDARAEFAGARGGFLLASSAIVTDPVLSTVVPDMKAVPYPVVGAESVAPLSGVSLAVPEDARDPALSYEAVACLTSAESQQTMMIGSGHGATRKAAATRRRRSRARSRPPGHARRGQVRRQRAVHALLAARAGGTARHVAADHRGQPVDHTGGVPASRDRPGRGRSAMTSHARRRRRPVKGGWGLVAPALLVLVVLTLWPLGRAVYTSLYSESLTTPDDTAFVGPDNYVEVVTNADWWVAVALTLVFVARRSS